MFFPSFCHEKNYLYCVIIDVLANRLLEEVLLTSQTKGLYLAKLRPLLCQVSTTDFGEDKR